MKRILAAALGTAALALAPSAQTIDLEIFLTGANSTPPHASTASGKASLSFNPSTGILSYDITVAGMVATVAHVHEAPAGTPGGVVVPLAGVGPNHFMGASALGPGLVTSLLENQLYVNVHSAAQPNGEVRGQLDMPRFLAVPLLDGPTATPPQATPGTGLGVLTYNAAAKTFDYDATFSNLLGVATIAHVHNAPPGIPGPILFGLTQVGPNQFKGTSPAQSDATIAQVLSGGTYINVHSTFAPGGEIRGQVKRGFLNTNTPHFGIVNGGTQTMDLRAGPSHAGQIYVLLGSLSGTSPGLPAGSFNMPLNFDAYFNFTLTNLNAPPFSGSLGVLNAEGAAAIGFSLPAGFSAALVGLHLDHAAAGIHPVTGAVTFTTNPAPLDLL